MISRTSLIVTLTLLFAASAFAQGARTSDDTAIRQTVQRYFDGWRSRDVSLMKRAFHPRARWLAPARSDGSGLREIAIGRVYARVEGSAPIDTASRVLAVDVTGRAATVKVEVAYPEGILGAPPAGVVDTEYLSLIKFADGWRIVSKVSHPRKSAP